jgi:ferredoxin-NADP reductase
VQNNIELIGLDPENFWRAMEERRNVIVADSAEELPREYAMNILAARLHPHQQYFIISQVKEHGPDAKSYVLEPDKSCGATECAYFSAGQYLAVYLEIGGSRLWRPYSICSGPAEALQGRCVLTVKRAKDGFASEFILANWQAGTKVVTSGPLGHFSYEPLRDAKTVVGLAGGSGITPFHSLACAIRDGVDDFDLVLLYGSRNSDDILLKEEFDAIAAQCDRVKVVHVLSDEKKAGYENGFLTAELIQRYAPAGDYSVFVCGPRAMYDFLETELPKLGLSPRRVRHELFGEYKISGRESGYAARETNAKIVIRGEERTIKCLPGESLLSAMERAGIAAPSQCRSGECGYCRSRLLQGEVFVPSHVDGRRLADFKYGGIHPCCSFPLGDTAIEVPM